MMLAERLSQPGPKRLLALDGGGIRGVLTLGYLAEIEANLRIRHDDLRLVLSDYFDLIGGTSTAPSSRPGFRWVRPPMRFGT